MTVWDILSESGPNSASVTSISPFPHAKKRLFSNFFGRKLPIYDPYFVKKPP